MNVITWKKKPNSYENLASYTLDSTYKLISCINWIACFLVAYADFLSCSKIQLQWGYIPHCIDNFFATLKRPHGLLQWESIFPGESLIHSHWGFWSRGHYANCFMMYLWTVCTEVVASSETNISTNFCGSTNNNFLFLILKSCYKK